MGLVYDLRDTIHQARCRIDYIHGPGFYAIYGRASIPLSGGHLYWSL